MVGVPDATWGEQVAAFVRPADGRRPTRRELSPYCRERLAPHKVPQAIGSSSTNSRSPPRARSRSSSCASGSSRPRTPAGPSPRTPSSRSAQGCGYPGAGQAVAMAAARREDDTMEYRTLGRSGCAVSTPRARHDDVRQRDRRGRLARAARRVRRGRRDADRHRRRLHARRLGGDHRALAGQAAAGRARARSCSPPRAASRWATGRNDVGLSRRHLRDALDASLRRLGVDARRPLPGARVRPAHAAGGDAAASSTTPCAAGKIPYVGLSNYTGWQIQKVVDLAEFRGLARPVTLQPQYNLLVARDRVGDRARLRVDRARAAAVVAARRRLADRQVHARRAADRRDAARRGPGARRRGLRPPQRRSSARGT